MELNDIMPSFHRDFKSVKGDKLFGGGNSITLRYLGYNYILRHLKPLLNKSILDSGCGYGEFSIIYTKKSIA
jgi:hypothetical protein